jgi:hypothetical protein
MILARRNLRYELYSTVLVHGKACTAGHGASHFFTFASIQPRQSVHMLPTAQRIIYSV